MDDLDLNTLKVVRDKFNQLTNSVVDWANHMRFLEEEIYKLEPQTKEIYYTASINYVQGYINGGITSYKAVTYCSIGIPCQATDIQITGNELFFTINGNVIRNRICLGSTNYKYNLCEEWDVK